MRTTSDGPVGSLNRDNNREYAVFSCFAVHLLTNMVQVVPYFEPGMAAFNMFKEYYEMLSIVIFTLEKIVFLSFVKD